MLMNTVEYWAMNNPIRGAIQKRLEGPRLQQLCQGQADTVLEIGCGQGLGAEIIQGLFAPSAYCGIDLDPKMIQRARKKRSAWAGARFLQADAARLPFRDNLYDLVVDFGIIHHIPNWRDALAEIHRVLKPQGKCFFEELPVETWERGIGRPLKKVLKHPYDEMFRQLEFVRELETLGFDVEVHEDTVVGLYHFWGRATKTK